MNSLPESVLIKNIIIDNLFPLNTMDFKEFLNYKLVNRTWNNIISDDLFITRIKNILKKSAIYSLHIPPNVLNHPNSNLYSIFNAIASMWIKKFPTRLFNIFGSIDNYFDLPVLYNVRSSMIDNLYTYNQIDP